jgi:uncharacterized protein (DUF1800 family)
MGTPTVTRRDFFKKLTIQQANEENNNDPLFEKYSRKTLGPRVYKNEFVQFNGEEVARENELRVGNVTSGLAAYTGTWGEREAIHLLKRTGFGFRKTHVDTLVAAGNANAAANLVLTINPTPPAPPVVWYSNILADANGLAYGADWTNNPSPYVSAALNATQQSCDAYRTQGLASWLYSQAVNQDISIKEKMTWFWYHFIPIDFDAIRASSNARISQNGSRIFYSYMKMFRDAANGNFKTLIKNVALHPAMMFYLNNNANTATAPDENFARELMELFTLGKDPLSQYTQADVVAAAQVLTGWRVQSLDTINPTTTFVPAAHKTGNKQFSSFFNNTVINNPSPTNLANGALELDALLNMIFTKQQVISEYICRRLYRYFVYYDIDANIEANVIVPLAQLFVASNWEIAPVLNKLFKSQHFYDMANYGVYIKTPIDFTIGTIKAFNLNYNVANATNHEAQAKMGSYFNVSIGAQMEQDMGSIPNVSGWNAFYQGPAFHQYWINTNTIQKRFAFLQAVFGGFNLTYNTLTTRIQVDVIAYVQQFDNATIINPNLLINKCILYLLPIDLSQAQKDTIKLQTLLYQQTTDAYWTGAWNNYFLNPTNASFKAIVSDRLRNLLYTLVQLAEHQLM